MKILPPPGECYEELERFPWLQHCGRVISSDGMIFESSEERAIALVSSPEYEDHQLNRQNDLTLYLHANYRSEYQSWNEIVQHTKKRLSALLEGFSILCTQRGYPIVVAHSVRWDIVAYCQEVAYEGFGISDYHRGVIEIYRSGHLLCGYDGKFPEGKCVAH